MGEEHLRRDEDQADADVDRDGEDRAERAEAPDPRVRPALPRGDDEAAAERAMRAIIDESAAALAEDLTAGPS